MTHRTGSFTVTVQRAHLEWGTHRYTNSRGIVYGEGYIMIPANCARMYNLLNRNGTNGEDILGIVPIADGFQVFIAGELFRIDYSSIVTSLSTENSVK